jgi:hypothetical protein
MQYLPHVLILTEKSKMIGFEYFFILKDGSVALAHNRNINIHLNLSLSPSDLDQII